MVVHDGTPGDGDTGPATTAASLDAVEVYWRPGCGYCNRLLRALDSSAVRVRLHNIWEDRAARQFVQEHNRGNETVPTVAVGSSVLTNPSPKQFVEMLRRLHPGLIGGQSPPEDDSQLPLG